MTAVELSPSPQVLIPQELLDDKPKVSKIITVQREVLDFLAAVEKELAGWPDLTDEKKNQFKQILKGLDQPASKAAQTSEEITEVLLSLSFVFKGEAAPDPTEFSMRLDLLGQIAEIYGQYEMLPNKTLKSRISQLEDPIPFNQSQLVELFAHIEWDKKLQAVARDNGAMLEIGAHKFRVLIPDNKLFIFTDLPGDNVIGKGYFSTVVKVINVKDATTFAYKKFMDPEKYEATSPYFQGREKAEGSATLQVNMEVGMLEVVLDKTEQAKWFPKDVTSFYSTEVHEIGVFMPFYKGGTVKYWIKDAPVPLTPSERIQVCKDLWQATLLLFKHDLVHNDSTEENILFEEIDEHGRPKNLKLIDFHLCRDIKEMTVILGKRCHSHDDDVDDFNNAIETGDVDKQREIVISVNLYKLAFTCIFILTGMKPFDRMQEGVPIMSFFTPSDWDKVAAKQFDPLLIDTLLKMIDHKRSNRPSLEEVEKLFDALGDRR